SVRRIRQIVELVGFEPETNELITNTVYEWDQATDTFAFKGHSFLFDDIMELRNLTHDEMDVELQNRITVLRYLVEKDIRDYQEISQVIVSYYQYPDATVNRIRNEMGWEAGEGQLEVGGELLGG
ncbi:MAG: secretion system protein E, partial [Thermoplasmata archaeon]